MINVDADRHILLHPVLNCLAILGEASARSLEIIVSDTYLSDKYDGSVALDPDTKAQWAEYRWTVEEKREWVEWVNLAIQDRRSLI